MDETGQTSPRLFGKELRKRLAHARQEYGKLGGWTAFSSGQWLLPLIHRAFQNYWERATVEYFQAKYGTANTEKLAAKLIAVAAKHAGVLGALTGVTVSVDEIVALMTAGEGGIGLPANLAVAVAALGAEAILLVRLQVQLVANLGKLYGAPLDPDDPEDILTILAFALGGSVASAAGKQGMKIGGRLAGQAVKSFASKETLALIKQIAARAGIKILQRTLVKYTVPLASVAFGYLWNITLTKAVGRMALRHLKQRAAEIPPADSPGTSVIG